MEHRYYRRIAVQNRLLIYSGAGCTSGIVKNIGNGGLALEVADSTYLTKNAVVKLAVWVNGKLTIVRSHVIRIGETWAALMFTEDTSRFKQVLEGWLNGVQPDYLVAWTT
jgi:hypothetical protein